MSTIKAILTRDRLIADLSVTPIAWYQIVLMTVLVAIGILGVWLIVKIIRSDNSI